MKNAAKQLEVNNTSRIDIIRNAANNMCSAEYQWLQCALEVLSLNYIQPEVFAKHLRDSLIRGRGKFRNLMLVGPSNCAKTFMLKPLKCIFGDTLFDNPSNDKYAWVGAEKAHVILLQDFRYSRDLITWKDLLLLLEGETVKLPAPKNHFSSDIIIDTDVPIFATSKSPIVYKGPFNTTDERKTDMMDSRWKVVKFKHVFEENEQKAIKPCGQCFSKLVLMGEEQ